MLGVFDSGRGGLSAFSALRTILPDADLAYHADLSHLPYGDKSKEQLIPLIEGGIERLCRLGCERILIGCVTASSLHPYLSPHVREASFPIVDAVAHAAMEASRTGRIGVIATARSCREGTLCSALTGLGAHAVSRSVGEGLVELVEAGRIREDDPKVLRAVWHALLPHLHAGVDTVVLGCTHYPSLTNAFRRLLPPEISLIPSGEAGAKAFAHTLERRSCEGEGKCIFLS